MDATDSTNGYLRLKDAAAYLAVSERLVEREFQAGRLGGFKPSPRVLRFRRSDLDAWMERGRVEVLDDRQISAAQSTAKPIRARRRSVRRSV